MSSKDTTPFLKVYYSLFKIKNISHLEINVYCLLYSFIKNNRDANPGDTYIGELFGTAKRTIRTTLKKLETRGWIERIKVNNKRKFLLNFIPEEDR